MTRNLTLLVVGVSVLAAAVLWRKHRKDTLEEGERQAREIARLEGEIARLQGKVAAVETTTALATRARAGAQAQEGDQPSAPAPAKPAEAVPPRHRTAQEQAELFEGYFTTIDSLRGRAEDPALTGRFSEALNAVKPEFASLRKGHLDVITCGHGMCRIEMTFPNASDLAQAKTELLFQIGPMGAASTMYTDPARPHLFAYFSTPGTDLPPFPSAPN